MTLETVANTHWMDRVRAAESPAKRPRLAPLVSASSQESRAIITARAALHARTGVTQEELLLLMRDRHNAVLRASRPKRALLAVGLLAAGTAVSLVSSMLVSQALLLCGFGIVLMGVVAGCTILADYLGPQMGDLAQYMRPTEKPADAAEINALSRATQADPELSRLVADWWKDCGAPIRKQDLVLVRDFQRAKQSL